MQGEITKNKWEQKHLSFSLISHLGARGKIHLTPIETSPSAVIMTDQGLRSVLLDNYSSLLHGKGDRHESGMGCSYAKVWRPENALRLAQLIPPHQAFMKPQNCLRPRATFHLLLEGLSEQECGWIKLPHGRARWRTGFSGL